VVRATRVGADTRSAQIRAAGHPTRQSGKAPVQRLADRVSGVFVPVVIALAVARSASGSAPATAAEAAFSAAVAVLIIACPCALGWHADRAARRHGPRRAARPADQGPEILESTRRVDTIVARQDRNRHHRPR
jgi:Cu+-exporting ATPase